MSDATPAPAIGISVQCQIGAERQIVFQCFVPMDCKEQDLNGALDKLVLAAERQEKRTRLIAVRNKLKDYTKMQERAVEDMFRIDAEHDALAEVRKSKDRNSLKRNPELTAQQLQEDRNLSNQRTNAETTIRRVKNDIDELRAEIVELEAFLGA